jgi:hypothetical protein
LIILEEMSEIELVDGCQKSEIEKVDEIEVK